MIDDLVLMWRDASFWQRPGRASRFHLPRVGETGPYGHPIAVCNRRINLDDEHTIPEPQAAGMVCHRCAKVIASQKEGNGNG